jgi:hypothetical protein
MTTLLSAATATGAGGAIQINDGNRTFQAVGSTTNGAGAATVKIQVSNDAANWIDLATISLTLGTTATTDGFASSASWGHVRANVTAISGTGASVSVFMG